MVILKKLTFLVTILTILLIIKSIMMIILSISMKILIGDNPDHADFWRRMPPNT